MGETECHQWHGFTSNCLPNNRRNFLGVMDLIRRRRLSVFRHIHVARLTQGTPAHNALHCQVGLASGRSLGRDWRRRPGRPRARWTDQLRNDTGSVPANLWRCDGPRWLRDDDDEDDEAIFWDTAVKLLINAGSRICRYSEDGVLIKAGHLATTTANGYASV